MTTAFVFWFFMLLWALFGIPWAWPADRPAWRPFGFNLIAFVLVALLGYRVFGNPLIDAGGGTYEQRTSVRTSTH